GALPSRWLAGDPNVTRDGWRFEEHLPPPPPDPAAELLARLNVPPIPEDKRGKVDAYHDYLPAPLKAEWEAYAQRFVQYYGLDGAGQDRVRTVVSKHEDDTVRWLLEGEKKVPRQSSATGTIEVTKKTPERVRDYQAKLDEIREIRENYTTAIGDGTKARLEKTVAEEKAQRAALLADLNDRTEKMKSDLRGVLTYEQRRMAAMPDTDAQPPEPPKEWSRLAQLNSGVRW